MEAGIHHNSGLSDTIQETAIFGMPLGSVKEDCKSCKGGSLGGIAASLGYVNHGSFSGRDSLGLESGSYHARDFSGSLGWGMELLSGFSGGIVMKGNQSNFASKSYNAFTTEIGVLNKLIPALDLGLTYSNLNLGNKIGGSQLVSGLRLGAAWTVDKHLLLAASGELQNKAMNRLQLGTEYLIGNTENKVNVLALRAGYQASFPDPQLSGLTDLTMGLGYTITRSLAFDYAMVPAGELGASHRFSLTYKFNCPEKAKPPVAVVVAAAPMPEPETVVMRDAPANLAVKEIILEDSHFDFDSSALQPVGMAALRENVQLLKDSPKDTVRVQGYTSMSGTRKYNQLLSERRAKAVEVFLVENGIAKERVTTIGYGETRPAEYEVSPKTLHTEAAKANKRVIFTVTVN
jgi:outer membrane protein OmpA-like peptidoglycan-associated protein